MGRSFDRRFLTIPAAGTTEHFQISGEFLFVEHLTNEPDAAADLPIIRPDGGNTEWPCRGNSMFEEAFDTLAIDGNATTAGETLTIITGVGKVPDIDIPRAETVIIPSDVDVRQVNTTVDTNETNTPLPTSEQNTPLDTNETNTPLPTSEQNTPLPVDTQETSGVYVSGTIVTVSANSTVGENVFLGDGALGSTRLMGAINANGDFRIYVIWRDPDSNTNVEPEETVLDPGSGGHHFFDVPCRSPEFSVIIEDESGSDQDVTYVFHAG